ncbi:MAG: hypothetical protein FJ150_07325 [Euryarchaeota archaeon]|nr:hypothetical protein [Euryarchaeota archaeon]
MDNKGYAMSALSFLLIIPAVLLVTVFVDMSHIGGESEGLVLKSDAVFCTAMDIENQIPVMGKEVLRETADGIVESGDAIIDSRKTVKNVLQAKMCQMSELYQNKMGLEVNCRILSLDSSSDPFYVEIKSTVYVRKDNIVHNETISQNISIERLKDPLPFIKCKNYGGVNMTDTRILYGSSLVAYLNAKNVSNAFVYENASSPLFIKKCPYDPYISHGTLLTLKNCIDNGYFHESNDGACFLCRLEGKAVCPHYGLETFVIPSPTLNSSLISAPCSSDHVIFNDSSYPGMEIQYNLEAGNYYKLFLDNGHRSKYGLPYY